jgi:hypothetical protein
MQTSERSKTHSGVWLAGIPGHKEDGMFPFLSHRQRQGEVHERIEGDGNLKYVVN